MAIAAAVSIVWAPQPGSQTLFLQCPIYEALYEGTRGPGKSDALLVDFAQHVGRGFGAAWRGVLFRRTFPDLSEIVVKSRRIYARAFPGATFNEGKHTWTFPTGESLRFAHIKALKDYDAYHGHEYPWIGWDELGTYPSPELYDLMKSCCRSSTPGLPRKYRSTANPYGIGHNWLKRRFVDPAPAGVPIRDDKGNLRVRITGHWSENKRLLEADPEYIQRLLADRNKHRRKAWVLGAWDVVAGGMLDDLWDPAVHVLAGSQLWAPSDTPASWRIDRAMDWGSAKPFSVGWWAESDGTPAPNGKHYARGTVVRIAEWYGWDGENANEGAKLTDVSVARGIRDREEAMGIRARVKPGAADAAIFVKEPGKRSLADVMSAEGVPFVEAPKKPGSRKTGAETVRRYLEASSKWAEACASSSTTPPMEHPGLYVFETCRDGFLRTVPVIPRDENDPEDVDTDAEDHVYDETRYRLQTPKRSAGSVPGMRV